MKIIIVLIAIAGLFPAAHAEVLEAVGGAKTIKVERGGQVLNLETNAALKAGDTIKTDSGSTADVRFPNRSLVRLSRDAVYVVGESKGDDSFFAELKKGVLRVLVPERKDKSKIRFEIKTPESVVGVRGTEFYLEAKEGLTELYTLHGEVSFASRQSPDNIRLVGAGKRSRVAKGAAAPSELEDFSTKDLLKRLGDKKGLFGELADRQHGMSVAVKAKAPVSQAPVKAEATAKPVQASHAKEKPAKPEAEAESGQDKLNREFIGAVVALDLAKVKQLEKAGANVRISDEHTGFNSALHLAVTSAKDAEKDKLAGMIDYLVDDALIDVDSLNGDKLSPLLVAVSELEDEEDALVAVEILLEHEADKDIKSPQKKTALQIASSRKFKEVERLLKSKK